MGLHDLEVLHYIKVLMMTSTEINVGLSDGRSSSRVLKPPGGGHTNLFGDSGEEPTKQLPRNQRSEIKDCFQFDSETKKAKAESVQKRENNTNNEQEQKQEDKATPDRKTEQPGAPQRVRVPPGGFSSGLW
ncbi:hypothetical protein Trydic_g11912 [Trypoxylus dichotomus]